jgi:hypothetical protein
LDCRRSATVSAVAFADATALLVGRSPTFAGDLRASPLQQIAITNYMMRMDD